MYKIQRKVYTVVASLILAVATSSAHATLVNFEVTGYADFWADEGNEFGLELNEAITATGTFNDSVLTSGEGTIDFSDGSGNSLTITFGSMTFYESDDADFLNELGLPFMVIDADPANFELSFYTTFGSSGSFLSEFDVFDAVDNLGEQGLGVNGTWDATSLTITPVPVPAALWLFGSGLICLAGVTRQRKAA